MDPKKFLMQISKSSLFDEAFLQNLTPFLSWSTRVTHLKYIEDG